MIQTRPLKQRIFPRQKMVQCLNSMEINVMLDL